MTGHAAEGVPKQLSKGIMIGIEMLIGSNIDTKGDLHARKRYSKRGNLRISPINDTYDEIISLFFWHSVSINEA